MLILDAEQSAETAETGSGKTCVGKITFAGFSARRFGKHQKLRRARTSPGAPAQNKP